MRGAAVARAEHDAGRVRGEARRRARIAGPAHHHVAIEARRQRLKRSAVSGHGEQAGVAHHLLLGAGDEQRRPIRHPFDAAHHRGRLGDTLGRAAGRVGHEHRHNNLEVAIGVHRGRPCEARAVGRPRGAGSDREVALGEFRDLAAVKVGDEQVPSQLADETRAVTLEAEPPRNDGRSGAGLALGVAGGLAAQVHRDQVRQPRAVGRPRDRAETEPDAATVDSPPASGSTRSSATSPRPDATNDSRVPSGDQHGRAVVRALGELGGRAVAVDLEQPDGGAVLVGVAVGRREHERHPATVGRQLRVRWQAKPVEVVQLERATSLGQRT